MGNTYITGLKHFRSFRFSFAPEDKVKYKIKVMDRNRETYSLIHGEHQLINLSLSGFGFESDQILDPEKEIFLELDISKKRYQFKGRLVRGSRHRERRSYFTYGVKNSNTESIDERCFIEDLVYHFKSKRLRKELVNLLIHQVTLGDPDREDILSVMMGLYSDLQSFDERGDFLEIFMLQTKKMFRCQTIRFYSLDFNKEDISSIHPFQIAGKRKFSIDQTLFKTVLHSKQIKFIHESQTLIQDPFFSLIPLHEGDQLKNLLIAPILNHQQEVQGFIELANFKKSMTKERILKYEKSLWMVSFLLSTLYEDFSDYAKAERTTKNSINYSPTRKSEHQHIIIGESDHVREIRAFIQKNKTQDKPLLLLGGPGTGKELLARIIHDEGERASMPFGVTDVSDWNDSVLLEEFFLGSESKVGKFELYSGGTFVIKNIDLMSLSQQEKFLKLYANRYSIRLVVTSHLSFLDLQKKLINNFKSVLDLSNSDVFTLLNLEGRGNDIEVLSRHFLAQECLANGFLPKNMSKEVEDVFYSYSWPGNIRELELAVKRCVWAYQSSQTIQKIPAAVAPLFDQHDGQYKAYQEVLDQFPKALNKSEREQLFKIFKYQMAQKTLAECQGDAQKAREILDLSTSEWHEWLSSNETTIKRPTHQKVS